MDLSPVELPTRWRLIHPCGVGSILPGAGMAGTGEASGLAGTRLTPEEGAREKELAKLRLLGTAVPEAASPWLGAGIPGVSLQAEHEGCSAHPTLVGKAGFAAARPLCL